MKLWYIVSEDSAEGSNFVQGIVKAQAYAFSSYFTFYRVIPVPICNKRSSTSSIEKGLLETPPLFFLLGTIPDSCIQQGLYDPLGRWIEPSKALRRPNKRYLNNNNYVLHISFKVEFLDPE